MPTTLVDQLDEALPGLWKSYGGPKNTAGRILINCKSEENNFEEHLAGQFARCLSVAKSGT